MGKKKGGSGSKEKQVYAKTDASAIPDYKPKNNLMPKVSKEAKLLAAGVLARGGCRRTAILSFGSAEENFRTNGRLVFGGGKA